MKFRVWIDPLYHKYSSEDDPLYAVVHEEYDAESAALAYAEARYEELGHCDPGAFLVRDLETGIVTGFTVKPRVTFCSKQYAVRREEE